MHVILQFVIQPATSNVIVGPQSGTPGGLGNNLNLGFEPQQPQLLVSDVTRVC
jgi:hypothetical protein